MTFSLPSPTAPKGGAISGRTALVGVVAALLALGAYNSFFTVNPTERAGVRMFGTVVSEKPVGPGLHLKAPFVSSVDYAQVSLTNLHVPAFSVNTIDNQKIDLDINVTYSVPDSAVFHLLYEVGRSGSADITDNIIPVVQDRVGRVFAARNTNSLSENREAIQAEATRAAANALRELFRIELQSLQIARIGYSQAFIASNEKSVTAKNDAIAEENRVKVSEFQAKQRTTMAEGEANQARARAAGEADAIRARAQADRDAAVLQGQGQAARLRSEIEGVGGFNNYLAVLAAQARLRWDGKSPSMLIADPAHAPTLLTPAIGADPQISPQK